MELINLLEQPQCEESTLRQEFAKAVKVGLSAPNKWVSSKYLYDTEGSRLFQQITALEDYYLTNTEMAIIQSIKDELPALLGDGNIDIIELGVGDGHKSYHIIKSFVEHNHKMTYYPIDISADTFRALQKNFIGLDKLNLRGIVAEYSKGILHCTSTSSRKKFVLFLGSNIGNLTLQQARQFLTDLRKDLRPGDYLLIGFDLKKDIELLLKAYNDSQGITSQFNLNLLYRIQRELGGRFDENGFKHLAVYNPKLGAMESYLISLKQQRIDVSALNWAACFDAYEPIHLEYSFKYSQREIQRLADDTGFELIRNFTDEQERFADSLWQVPTSQP